MLGVPWCLVQALIGLADAPRVFMRRYMVGRCACRDAEVSGYSLAAGTTVLISPYLMHRDAKVWGADVDDFKPERWEAWQSKEGYGGFMTLLSGLGPNGSYLPFGGGPRYVSPTAAWQRV